jgi:mannose-6-phosphate isomerase
LGELLGKAIGPEPDYAESWEVVDHGVDQSVVDDGPLRGRTLAELMVEYPSWIRSDGQPPAQFPLLLKYLDCNRVLSVQVHPNDQYAASLPRPDLGKTEAWYIVASTPESLVYAGLKPGVDQATLGEAIEAGETDQVLHSFHPEPGDCLFIPAGTVHALGAGLLVAEIQQSSDTTFRLFDWNRVGDDGNPRPLHIEQALEVTDYALGPVRPRKSDPSRSGWQSLVECDKFALRSLESGEATLAEGPGFQIVTVPRGRLTLHLGEDAWTLSAGDTLFLPAGLEPVTLVVDDGGTALAMGLPDEGGL